jgi:hypothetical protein
MHRLIREPLLHFFVLGALLFGFYNWLHRGLLHTPTEIVVSRGQLQSINEQFQRVWQRPATPDEMQRLIDNWVREEIYYREGVAMGLDRDDPVIRRRINQKLGFIIEGATPTAPTVPEMQAWLDAHSGDYVSEPVYSLRQVYFDPSRHGKQLEADMISTRRALENGKKLSGDATMLPASMNASASEVSRTFGNAFEESLRTLAVGGWQGPVRSGFGLHLVELTARNDKRPAKLEEVRTAVERDLLHARVLEAEESYYGKLRASYTVRIDASVNDRAAPAG